MIRRRLQSIAGFFFLLFLCEHLFTNSQATLFLGDDGKGFIDAVNWIHSLPYLQVIELTFIGLPLLVHVWFGVERVMMAKYNSSSLPGDGSHTALPYWKNIAFTWQRITSILLIVAIGLHIYYMRFLKEPQEASLGIFSEYFVKASVDPGLYTLAPRLDLALFDKEMISQADEELRRQQPFIMQPPEQYNKEFAEKVRADEKVLLQKDIVATMKSLQPASDEVVVMAHTFGTASLMMLRDTYKSILLCTLYSLFVIMAAFHGCNGLWTFAITWGVALSAGSQRFIRLVSNMLMALLIFFGLACIWGVYWINLRY